jgi:flagellar hook-basal body complex protein FliE
MTDPLGLINSARGPAGMPRAPQPPTASGAGPSFKDVLMQNIEQVNRLQQDAATAVEDLLAHKRDDVTTVLLAKQKADMAFQMLQQVRNKLVDAYEEIKQMRV